MSIVFLSAGWDKDLREELERFNFILVVPGILRQLEPLFLLRLVHHGFLFWYQSVHLLRKSLFYNLAVTRNANANDFGERSHEFRVLKIIVPVQLYDSVNGLIERTKYIDDGDAVSLILVGNLAAVLRPHAKLILLNSLIYPFRNRQFRHANPAPDEVCKKALDVKRKRNTVCGWLTSYVPVVAMFIDLLRKDFAMDPSNFY